MIKKIVTFIAGLVFFTGLIGTSIASATSPEQKAANPAYSAVVYGQVIGPNGYSYVNSWNTSINYPGIRVNPTTMYFYWGTAMIKGIDPENPQAGVNKNCNAPVQVGELPTATGGFGDAFPVNQNCAQGTYEMVFELAVRRGSDEVGVVWTGAFYFTVSGPPLNNIV